MLLPSGFELESGLEIMRNAYIFLQRNYFRSFNKQNPEIVGHS